MVDSGFRLIQIHTVADPGFHLHNVKPILYKFNGEFTYVQRIHHSLKSRCTELWKQREVAANPPHLKLTLHQYKPFDAN